MVNTYPDPPPPLPDEFSALVDVMAYPPNQPPPPPPAPSAPHDRLLVLAGASCPIPNEYPVVCVGYKPTFSTPFTPAGYPPLTPPP